MSLLDLSSIKRVELYKSLINNNTIDKVKDADLLTRYNSTVNELKTDLEKNYPGLLENPDEDKSGSSITTKDTNYVGGSFVWDNDNIPSTTPEYYVYDNSDENKWDTLRRINCYPDAMDNVNATCKMGDDNFETYNNVVFNKYFEHLQASIMPKEDKTMDGWFDVGLKCVMYQSGRPYSVPNFQKSFYVWYIRGDGSDYPYTGQFGAAYPGQEYLFKYRYQNAERCMVRSGTVLKIKGTNPTFRYGSGQQGFYAKLNNPDEYTNSIAKIDLGLIEETGQRWHYQGFTLKCFRVFDKYPTNIELNMEGERNTLDITKLIETSLTWEFDEFTILSGNTLICDVSHDWVKDPSDPKYVLGPSKIELIGGYDGTTTITVTARPKGSLYTEIITIDVTVKQLYNGITTLLVQPDKLLMMEGDSVKLYVTTDAPNWSATTDTLGVLKVYTDKVEGLKQGKGNLTIKAQAHMSMPATVTIPFTVTKFIPDPVIDPNVITLTVPATKTLSFKFTTNCPRANIIVDQEDLSSIKVAKIRWEDKTTPNPDTKAKDYPIHTGWIDVTGIDIGMNKVYITGYIENGGTVLERVIIISIIENPDEMATPDEDDGSDRLAVIKQDDAYLSFHHQHQGQFTYLVSNYDVKNGSKILVVPKPTEEQLNDPNNPNNEFDLALLEDMTLDSVLGNKSTEINPNNLDYKELYDPYVGFTGTVGKEHNVYINTTTLEMFISTERDGVVVWKGSNGTMVNDVDYPFPGEKGFGVGPCSQEIAAYYGLIELPGCWDKQSPNYGHYLDYSGTIVCYIPLHYYHFISDHTDNTKLSRIEVVYPMAYTSKSNTTDFTYNSESGKFTFPSLKTRDKLYIKGTEEHTNFSKKLVVPMAFINNNKLLPGIFIDKNKTSDFSVMYKPGQRGGYTLQTVHKDNSIKDGTFNTGKMDKSILNPFSKKSRPNGGIVANMYSVRINIDTAYMPAYVRNMLNYDAISHATNTNHYNTNNCSWLNNDKGDPSIDYRTNLYTYNKYRSNSITNTVDRNKYSTNMFNSYLKDYSNLTHTGMDNGILGMSDGVLEACIGVYYNITHTTANGSIASTNFNILAANPSTDYRNYSDNLVDAIQSSNNGVGVNLSTISNFKHNTFSNVESAMGYATYIKSNINKGSKSYLTNSFTPTGNLAVLYTDDVSGSYVHSSTDIEAMKFNLGYIGNSATTTKNGAYETNISTEYAVTGLFNTNNSLPNTTFGNINIEDNRSIIFYGLNNVYDDTDTADDSTIRYYCIPLFGGIVSPDALKSFTIDNNKVSVPQLEKVGMFDVTWWRLGYNLGKHTKDPYTTVPVSTRLCILPDMVKIKAWVDNGNYNKEYINKGISIFKHTIFNNEMYKSPFDKE